MGTLRNPKWTYPGQWIFWPLSWLMAKCVAQDPDLVVLTSFHGDGYRGNTRRLFEWLHARKCEGDCSGKRVVWLSRNKRVVAELQSRFGSDCAVYLHSLHGALLLVKSKVALLTHGTSDYPFMYIPARTHVIQTYHGFPTKRGEFMRLEGEDAPGPVESFYLNRRFQPIDTFLSTSDFVTQIFSQRFGLPIERFLKIGFPVNDELLERSPDPEWIKQIYPHADAKTKLILYAPTFRYKSATQLFPFKDFDPGDLLRFLELNNLVLAVRIHPNDSVRLPWWVEGIDRMVRASDKEIEQVNELIVNAAVILTDYSSIYIEGLVRDIPPVFIPYDLHEYERGFPFEYAQVTPGPQVDSYANLKVSILDAIAGAQGFKKRRQEVMALFYGQVDAHSTFRLWQYISRI